MKYSSNKRVEQKIVLHPNTKDKITYKIVYKMQCLKNDLSSNISEGSLSSVNPIATDVF